MSIAELIKAEYAKGGAPLFKLFKGDIPGHEFHGNQYADGSGGQNEMEQRMAANAAVRQAQLTSKAADEHSRTAGKEKSVDAHLKAANSNREAERANRQASRLAMNERDQVYHAAVAQNHAEAAAYHENRVKSA